MSGDLALGRLNEFLRDVDTTAFDLKRFNSVCDEAICYLRDHPNANEERQVLISSLASSMIVFKPSIPENAFIDLWDRVEATFNPAEQADPDLRELVDRMIRDPQ